MRENIYFYFMHTHVLIILSLVFLWFYATTAASFGHQQLVAAAEGGAKTCIDKERQALLDLKAHLHDPNDFYNWRPAEEADSCQWIGVGCNDQTGHVTSLYLSGLEGEIIPLLLNLTFLNYLSLSGNSFHGTIPKFICSMTHLTELYLAENQFTAGTIPDCIGNMTQLNELYIVGNSLSGVIPMFICSLTHLTYLNLGENQFTACTLPECIGNMTQLTVLYLFGNSFGGVIPKSVGSLTKLRILDLSDNTFYGTIPSELGNLTNLDSLGLDSVGSCRVENLDWLSSLSSLHYLHFDGISLSKINNWVNVIIGLQNLYYLKLDGCDLSQVMHPFSPSVNNSSSSLVFLYLDNNNLKSSVYRWLIPLIGNKLTTFSVSGNKFDEKLSNFLNNLSGCTSATTLRGLDASSNQFTGSLSDEIQHFSSLTKLNLSSNQLDGTISDKLWQLPSLKTLYVSSDSLRGVISENIGKSNLLYIDLSYNSVEGVPPFIDDVSNLSGSLQYIDFSSNKLGPRFPKWVQKLKNLRHLDLSNNGISDTVSTEYWNQWQSSQLNYLDLSFNNISGTLAESLNFDSSHGLTSSFSRQLSFLDLSRNKFQGRISILCRIYEKIEFLDLSQNSLTGQLPDCLKNFTHLRVLNLGQNSLSGSIPPSIGRFNQLETLRLYNNNFSGRLPLSLKNCTKLSLLDLGANNLYGNIPVWIGKNLSRLFALSLKSNNFFGTIPSQICELVSLRILDSSFNNLHGKIPPCVNNLTSMVMVQKGFIMEQNKHRYKSIFNSTNGAYYVYNSYIDYLLIEWQGKVNEFSSTLGLLKAIDLSSNNLTGQIPNEVTYLHGLVVLDLSNNSLVGEIPRNIGQMTDLLTLNLSRNMLSGEMPSSMSEMHSLNDLDVSFNNLSGRVPSSTQLQSFEPERFTGNAGLCGLPTTAKCLTDEDSGVPNIVKRKSDGYNNDEFRRWFYIGGATGFATGFWIICSVLLLNRRGRRAFYQFHDSVRDLVYVTVAVFMAKWRRDARA